MPCMRCLRCCVLLHAVALPCAALLDVLSLFKNVKKVRRSIDGYDYDSAGADGQEYEIVAEGDLAPGLSPEMSPGLAPHRTGGKLVRVVRKHRQKRQATFQKRASATEFCQTYSGTGWHSGSYEAELRPKRSPNGIMWTWEDCARECASRNECQFWTLQLKKGSCFLMSKQGQYHDTEGHIEGPKDPGCLRVQPSGPYAGEYEVRYHGQMRSANMIVHCNSSVSQPGVLTDFQKYDPRNLNFHIADTPATQCLRKMPRSTVFIFNTQDPSKFECLQQDGMTKLLGSRYYASGQLFGDVEYHLIKTFSCAYEVLNGTNETVLTETINEIASDDDEVGDEEAEDLEAPEGQGEAEAFTAEDASEGTAEPAAAAESSEAPPAAVLEEPAAQRSEAARAAAAEMLLSNAKSKALAAAEEARSAMEGTPAEEAPQEAPRADASGPAGAAEAAKAGKCLPWCADHTDDWATKCVFLRCGGCGPCLAQAQAAPGAANEEAPTPAPDAAAHKEEQQGARAPAAAPAGSPATAGGAEEPAAHGGGVSEPTAEDAEEPAAHGGGVSEPTAEDGEAPWPEGGQAQKPPAAPAEFRGGRRPRRARRRGPGSGSGRRGGDEGPQPAGTLRAGVPQMWQEASLVQYLGWTLDSSLSKIKESVDAHLQKIQNLTAKARGSPSSLESLSRFLEDLSEVSGNRQRLGALVGETLEEIKQTLATTGHDSMLPALEECLEANGQASTLADWYFGLAGLANGTEPSPQPEVTPTEDKERILALDSNGIEFKRHEDGLASRLRGAFQTVTREVRLPKAVADVPQAKQQLDGLLDQVLHKATGVSWSLHTSAVDLASLVRVWSAAIAQAGE